MLTITLIIAVLVIYSIYKLNKNTSAVDLSLLPDKFVIFDLETTGLNPHKNEIIEIGAIKVDKSSPQQETFQYLLKPVSKIPARATEINGITQEMVNTHGRDPAYVIKEFIEFIGDHRLIAFNADFDMSFLAVAADNHGYKINNQYSCALKMAKKAWPDLKSYKLENLAKAAGLSTNGNHRALKDCELTAHIYMAAASKLKTLT